MDTVLQQAFQHAARAWEEVSLYSDFDFLWASGVESADVILTWTGVPLPVNTSNCPPGGSNAFTTFCLNADRTRLEPFPAAAGNGMPSRVRFIVSVRPGPTQTAARLRTLVTHELGHVLGLAQHSANAADLMFADPANRDVPNTRDRASLQVLYQTRADITP
jgi:predicted Zn-dependent protease